MDQRWLLAVAVGLVAVLAGAWWGRGVEQPPAPVGPVTATTAPATTAVAEVVVHVSGWVTRPGLVTVAPGSRVGDVLAAAGGVEPGARLAALNLAEAVADGQQVVVPGPGGEEPAGAGGGETSEGAGPVPVNTASAARLESLPGVGPVLAERIVAHREANGPFQRVEDLLEVSGIGEAKLGSIRDLVAVP